MSSVWTLLSIFSRAHECTCTVARNTHISTRIRTYTYAFMCMRYLGMRACARARFSVPDSSNTSRRWHIGASYLSLFLAPSGNREQPNSPLTIAEARPRNRHWHGPGSPLGFSRTRLIRQVHSNFPANLREHRRVNAPLPIARFVQRAHFIPLRGEEWLKKSRETLHAWWSNSSRCQKMCIHSIVILENFYVPLNRRHF